MAKLLYIKASPRGNASFSENTGDAFAEAWQKKNKDGRVSVLDLFDAIIPEFGALAVSAKYRFMHGQECTAEEKKNWKAVEAVIADFKSADKYLFAVPMWNFGVPYRLKQYIDVIVQPGYTFSFSPADGYKGLVTGKPALVVSSRGGEYCGEGASWDHQKTYMELFLGFVGFTDIRHIVVEPTLALGPEKAKAAQAAAMEKARGLAAGF